MTVSRSAPASASDESQTAAQPPEGDPDRTASAPGELQFDAVLFDGVRDKTPKPWHGTFARLLGTTHKVVRRKSGARCFGAARYVPGATRGNAGVEAVTALVFDFDHVSGSDSRTLLERLTGRAHVIYTSFSHHKGGNDDCCYRVILPTSREMSSPEFEVVWRRVNSALGGLADPAARDPSRMWYLPACPPERRELAELTYSAGVVLDIDAVLADSGDHDAPGPEPGLAPRPPSIRGEVGEGQRNALLTSLAGVMRRRGFGEAAITAALLVENEQRCLPPVPEAEVRAVAASVCRYQPESPLLMANLTDLGNAERLQEHVGQDLRYVHLSASWLCWSGRCWRRDETGEAMLKARSTVREFARLAAGVEDDKRRSALLKHAHGSESAGQLTSMLRLATCLLPVTPTELDRDPWLLNVANGTLDLRTGELRAHRRGDLITRLAPTDHDPHATCPLWESFLDRIMEGNQDLVGFLRRAVGYSLTGSTAEQALFLLHGVGANGKSTFLETIRAMLGTYSTQADFTTFLRQQRDGVRNDVARLVGARFVSAVEAEGGRRLAEAMVKQLTGGDTVAARFLFKEFFEFRPGFKLWLAANSKPNVGGTDLGIWRRFRLVPFSVTIPPEERDRDLGQKLRGELPGILAWAVRGCLEWQRDGLGLPAEVVAATEDYREAMDVLGGFLGDCCVLDAEAEEASKDLYAAYTRWCEDNGERPLAQREVGIHLAERGFERHRFSGGGRGWKGLRLRGESGRG